MATGKIARSSPFRVVEEQPDWDHLWPDDRVNCGDCRNKSGAMCVAFKRSHVPLDLVHRCEAFSGRKKGP